MMSESEWEEAVSRHIKSVMVKKGLDVPKLTELFLAKGYDYTRPALRGKLDRGKFSLVFYLQFMHVVGLSKMELVSPGDFEEMDIRLN